MAKKEVKKEVKKNGRPPIKIDWAFVDKCLEGGCSGIQTASCLGIHYDTLYDRVVKEFGKSFTDYSLERRQKGDSLLHLKQFNVAMKGDRTMLIWLGKQRLNQKENPMIVEQFNSKIGLWLESLKPDQGKGKLEDEIKMLKRLLEDSKKPENAD